MLKFLKIAIKSVMKQRYKNFEIIIVDNFSSDGTDKYVKSLKNKKIKFFKIKNHGVIGKSRNIGIKKSKGEWIAFLDADDQWLPNKLFDINKIINLKNFHVICSSEMIIDKIKNKKKIWHYGPYKKNFYEFLLRYGNKLSTSSSIVKKNFLFSKKILFSEKKKFSNVEDYDFFLNISRQNGIFYFSKKIHGKHLFHSESSTLKRKKINEALFSVIKHHVNLQIFTKDKEKLLSEINVYYKVKKFLENIYSKKSITSLIKLIFIFFSKPFIVLRMLSKIVENQKNVIRVN